MKKPIYLNNTIYFLLLESLVNNTDLEILNYSKKNNREEGVTYILENPSIYLLNEIKIFDQPDLLKNIIFDINDLEFIFNEKSIIDIKDGKDSIVVRRVIDSNDVTISLSEIKKSFLKSCTIDCH